MFVRRILLRRPPATRSTTKASSLYPPSSHSALVYSQFFLPMTDPFNKSLSRLAWSFLVQPFFATGSLSLSYDICVLVCEDECMHDHRKTVTTKTLLSMAKNYPLYKRRREKNKGQRTRVIPLLFYSTSCILSHKHFFLYLFSLASFNKRRQTNSARTFLITIKYIVCISPNNTKTQSTRPLPPQPTPHAMAAYPDEKALQAQQAQPGYPQQPSNAYPPPQSSQQQYFTQPPAAAVGGTSYPGAVPGPPTEFVDPTQPRPNDILPLHPAIIQQRQIAASLPPCPRGGYHELRSRQYVLSLLSLLLLRRACLSVRVFVWSMASTNQWVVLFVVMKTTK